MTVWIYPDIISNGNNKKSFPRACSCSVSTTATMRNNRFTEINCQAQIRAGGCQMAFFLCRDFNLKLDFLT